MPGVVGLVTTIPEEKALECLSRMLQVSAQSGLFETGCSSDSHAGVYVGWTIRRNASQRPMPFTSSRSGVSMVLSGEEYSRPDDPAELIRGYEDDANFPTALNGRFHGVLTDRDRRGGMLFNDRYGLHRLYYHDTPDALYFAAEAKAILAVMPHLRRLSTQGLGELISCGCVLENRSLFEDIHTMPPASAWTFQAGRIEQKSNYFSSREWESQPVLEQDAYYQQLRQVFVTNMPKYFSGSSRIGMSLTGGLDTRMIMAWRKPERVSLPCYSFGSMFRDCQDVLVARQVACSRGLSHQVIPVATEFLSKFPKYAERTVELTDGCADVSHSADLYVNEIAAQIAPVRMTGNYGGEVLRRVRAFKPVTPAPRLFAPELVPQIELARQTYARAIDCHPLSFAVFRQAPWHHYSLLSLEETQIALRSPFLDNEFVRTVFQAPDSACQNNDISLRLIADGDPSLASIPTDRGLAINNGGPRSAFVRKVLGVAFKAEYAYDYGMPHWASTIDRQIRSFHPERFFLGRYKFNHYRIWYRDYLADFVKAVLLDPRTLSRPYLNSNTVRSIVRGHLEGGRNYTTEIHKLLTLELISRNFLDRQ